MTLADVETGSGCRILRTADEYPEVQSRFYALGLYPGVTLKVLREAPLGDPIQVKLDHSLLSIRKRDAALVQVEKL